MAEAIEQVVPGEFEPTARPRRLEIWLPLAIVAFDQLSKAIVRNTLPLHDSVTGSGSNREYHVARPGAFLLRGYNLSGSIYLDLISIDAPAARPQQS